MDALETLVREALAEHAAEAPGPDRLLAGPRSAERGPRRWPYVLLAAAVVATVAVGVVALRGGSSGNPPAAPKPTFAPIPRGMQEVSYHGITIQVPDTLRPWYDDCAAPRNVVVTMDLGVAPTCPVGIEQERRTGTLVYLAPYQGGRPEQPHMQYQTGIGVRRNLPGPGVSVFVEASSRARAQAILATIRVTPVDRNGCASTLPGLSNPSADELLPGAPVAASVCTYTRVVQLRNASRYLLRSQSIGHRQLAALIAAIHGLPAGRGKNLGELPGDVRCLFTYANGVVRAIDVSRGDDPTVADGQHIAHDPYDSIAAAVR